MDIFNRNERQVVCVSDEHCLWGSNPKGRLKVGERYTVIDVDVYDWYTLVVLAEFPDTEFNSVLFEEIEED